MKPRTFAKLAWAALAYTVAVILWGAYVRATGSGAGCGAHWPLCNGEVIPRGGTTETIVELTHRVTSGLTWILAAFLYLAARRTAPAGAPVRRAAGWTFFFMTTESLVGASIVLLELVADDQSLARGWWMGAHLVNTFLLLTSMSLTAWYASGGERLRLRGQGAAAWAVLAALGGTLLLGVSGAVTALGDTLFPHTPLEEGLSPTAHLFLQLRVFHPLIALVVALVVLFGAGYLAATRSEARVRRFALAAGGLFVAQMAIGYVNVQLLAPVWMQIVHLFVADALWITLSLLAVAACNEGVVAAPCSEAAVTRA